MGRLICAGLTVHRRAADRVPGAAASPSPVKRILFLKLIEQGATVIAAPAIEEAVARVGRDNVFFCVFKENRAILDLLGLIPEDNVIELRHDNLAMFAFDARRALKRIRAERIDTVIDMEFLARAPAILGYLTGAERRVGLDRFTAEGPYRGDLLTHRLQFNPYQHTSIAYQRLVQALDEDPGELPMSKVSMGELPEPPVFTPLAGEQADLRAKLDRIAGRKTGRLVLLNANTGDLLPNRLWARDNFVTLGRQLREAYPDVTLVMTGAPSERAGALALAKAIDATPSGRCICLAGETTLREVLVLYTLADVLVTNDSGPGHFASMTDIHDIVLFGPETPALFGPLGGNRHVIYAELSCSPCVSPYNHRNSPCTNNVCMQQIEVREVFDTVARCLASPPQRSAS